MPYNQEHDDAIPEQCPEATRWPAASMIGSLAVFALLIFLVYGVLVALL